MFHNTSSIFITVGLLGNAYPGSLFPFLSGVHSSDRVQSAEVHCDCKLHRTSTGLHLFHLHLPAPFPSFNRIQDLPVQPPAIICPAQADESLRLSHGSLWPAGCLHPFLDFPQVCHVTKRLSGVRVQIWDQLPFHYIMVIIWMKLGNLILDQHCYSQTCVSFYDVIHGSCRKKSIRTLGHHFKSSKKCFRNIQ